MCIGPNVIINCVRYTRRNTLKQSCLFLSQCYVTVRQHIGSRQVLFVTRCTRGVRVVFSVARMRSSNSTRMNKLDFTTEKIGSAHITVFEIVAHRNVDN